MSTSAPEDLTERTAAVEVAELLIYPASVDGVVCPRRALVDSGASCNFVDQAFAELICCEQRQLSHQLRVDTANGDTMSCSRMIASAHIKLTGYEGDHDLVVMPHLDGFDLILGRSFLQASKAVVHHETASITWPKSRASHYAPRSSITPPVAISNPWQVLDGDDEHDEQHEELVDDAGSQSALSTHRSTPSKAKSDSPTRQRRDLQWPAARSSYATKPGVTVSHNTVNPDSSTSPHLTPSVRAALVRVQNRVGLYDTRMRPKDGKLPKCRGQFNHKMELNNKDAIPVKGHAIPLNAEERVQLAMDIRELEEAGLIVRSESEWASPAFYVAKDGGKSRRLVIDYRGLNRLLKKNAMTLPHIDELLARLGKAKFFSKIDLRSSYHQVLIRPEDCHLTAFVTPIGHFEWKVLPFGEANAPATFVQLMRHLVLADMTSRGVLDFVDDILVYSETAEDHVKDVSDVLDRLEKHELFIKPTKCQWMVQQVEFLGYTITATDEGTTIEPMKSKVEAVNEWPLPRTQTQMRSFLGFANTFRNFVDGFSRVAGPLFDLLKKLPRRTSPLRWSDGARAAFDELKGAIANCATLAVADETRPFVVHTDASDYAVGAVLSQRNEQGELRPIGFVSEKLTDVQYRWSVYDKELYSIVVALKRWQMHLMYARHPVEILNDHASLRFLLDQPKLTAKQTRWMALFSTFSELRFVHVKGSDNTRADALSRRADHDVGIAERQRIRSEIAKQQFADVFGKLGLPNARINTMIAETSAGSDEISSMIIAGYLQDAQCKKIVDEPERYGYRMRWDLLERIDDGSILVPDERKIRAHILRCIHDAPTSGHLGINKTYSRLSASYHWPNQWLEVAEYVRSCQTCQRAKQRAGRVPGLHQPIEIAPKAHTIALDFLGPLNRTPRGKNSIVVIIDSFTKRVFMEAVTTSITAEQTADVIVNRVVRHQGMPRAIRSDRDSRFTGDVWSSIWNKLGATIKLTTAHHHQANGLPERFMSTLLSALRCYCNTRGTDWDLYLPSIELAYNSSKHASTGMSPIELDIGVTARLPINLSRPEHITGENDSAAAVLDRIHVNEIEAFKAMLAAQERDKLTVDASRKDERYDVGDFAWLDTQDLQSMKLPGGKKLRSRWTGPFEISQVDGELNVKLKLPDDWQIHDVIHVSRLKRAHGRDDDRFPVEEDPANDDHAEESLDLGDHDVSGAAVAQLERDDRLDKAPRTRAATQLAHDRGERHDYVALSDAWDERRAKQQRAIASAQREQRTSAI